LFAFVAQKIADFLLVHSDSHGNHTHYRLGFTFSFTCHQTSLLRGTLIHWDKGWDIPEAVGKDPCAMLQEAIDLLGLPVLVAVLANDSVGTLLTRAYTLGQKGSTLGAVIFGTGTNAAYVENLEKIHRLGDAGGYAGGIMVVNTEWGCLDDEMQVLPSTRYDDELDELSADPGSQMFEKRVSGLYLGELLRLAILHLIRAGALKFKVQASSPVFRHHALDSSLLSKLANIEDEDYELAATVVEETLEAELVGPDEAQAICLLASAIARRAARLAGAALAAVVIQSGRLERPATSPEAVNANLSAYTSADACSTWRQKAHHFYYSKKLLLSSSLRFLLNLSSTIPVHDLPKPDSQGGQGEIIDFGADGSLIEFYPTFEMDMRIALREIPEIGLIGERRIQIGLAKDGSGVGAALMAQSAM
jgi:hexokinase